MSGRPKGSSRGGKKRSGHASSGAGSGHRQPVTGSGSNAGATGTDPEVTSRKMEDDVITQDSSLKLRKEPATNRNSEPPCRPGFGSLGTPATVRTNHAYLDISKDLKVHEYSITIRAMNESNDRSLQKNTKAKDLSEEEADAAVKGRLRKEVIRVLLQKLRKHARAEKQGQRNHFVTDFAGVLLVATEQALFRGNSDQTTEEVQAFDEAKKYRVTVKFTKTHSLRNLFDYLSTFGLVNPQRKETALQMLNIWLRYHSKADPDLVVSGSKTFPLHDRPNTNWVGMDLGEGLRAMRGIFASIRPATGRILVNLQVTHGSFYKAGALPEFMIHYRQDMRRLDTLLRMLKVEAVHLTARRNTGKPYYKTVKGLARATDAADSGNTVRFMKNPSKEFGHHAGEVEFKLFQKGTHGEGKATSNEKEEDEAGVWTTVEDYYRKNQYVNDHNIEVNKYPLINVGTKQKPAYMLAQLLRIKEGQYARADLSPAQTAAMIRFAARGPKHNYETLRTGRELINHGGRDPNPSLANLTLDPLPNNFGRVGELITVPARFLPNVKVRYYSGEAQIASPENKPTWNLRNIVLSPSGRLRHAIFCYIPPPSAKGSNSDQRRWQSIANQLWNGFRAQGLLDSQAPKVASYKQLSLTDVQKSMTNWVKQGFQHLFVILGDDSPATFNTIKFHGDIVYGLSNTCMRASTVSKNSKNDSVNPQYVANVALKVNLKSGGANQKVGASNGTQQARSAPPARPDNFAKEPFFASAFKGDPTMIVGIDVTHDTVSTDKDDLDSNPSTAALVASLDEKLGQWPAVLKVQKAGEMVKELGAMLQDRLERWKTKHTQYPKNILIYRDGVSEGEYERVLTKEYPQIREVCDGLYKATPEPPRITIVVAGKRHHVRFFPKDTKDGYQKDGNTKAGLLVERGITEVRNWDFYLQSHAAIQGTVKPVHYYVVHDEIFQHYHPRIQGPQSDAADQLQTVTHQLSYIFGRATLAVSLCTPVFYAHLACERAKSYLTYVRQGRLSGTVSDDELKRMQQAVTLHQNVREVMFYI